MPRWPKPLPNNWAVGPVSGITTDAGDHIWIIHRGEAVKQAGATPAPPVIEFDAAGNVVQAWGGAAPATTGISRFMASPSTERIVSGSAATATGTRTYSCSRARGDSFGRLGVPARAVEATTRRTSRARPKCARSRQKQVYVSDGEQNQNHRVIVFDRRTAGTNSLGRVRREAR